MARARFPSYSYVPVILAHLSLTRTILTLLLCTTGAASSLHDSATRAFSTHAALPLWLPNSQLDHSPTCLQKPREAGYHRGLYIFSRSSSILFLVLCVDFSDSSLCFFKSIFQEPEAAFPLVTVLGFDGITL